MKIKEKKMNNSYSHICMLKLGRVLKIETRCFSEKFFNFSSLELT